MVGKRRGGRRARRKSVSRQGLLGQQGVNLVERIVLEMGSRWTPSGPNEVGIDGYIELFDPSSREALGLTVAVQSKVHSALATDAKSEQRFGADSFRQLLKIGAPKPGLYLAPTRCHEVLHSNLLRLKDYPSEI